MRHIKMIAVVLGILASSSASAKIFTFDSDPFAGSAALTTPGRQVVAGEPFISFDASTDQFDFDQRFFDVGKSVSFANDVAGNIPASGLNVIVLESFDDDANLATLFGAGNAASLLAGQITSPGAGFFVYFNQNLNTARLVYSTDLNDSGADLKILARMTNLVGNPGALAGFGAKNFQISAAPEPATWAMLILGFGMAGFRLRRRKAAAGFADRGISWSGKLA